MNIYLLSLIIIFYLLKGVSSACDQTCTAGNYFKDCASGCTTCPQGHYCLGGTNALPTPCPVGKRNTATGRDEATDCTDCPSGSYSLSTGTITCQTCPQGYTCSGGSNLVKCDFGEYTSGTGQTSCNECEKGYYCPQPELDRIECPAGTYQDTVKQTTCKVCDPGWYQTATNQQDCDECRKGRKCPHRDSGEIDCERGSFSVDGQEVCTLCPLGQYTTGTRTEDNCDPCPSGRYCPFPSINPIQCPKGTISGGGTVSKCTDCVAGQFTTNIGSSACENCDPGFRCPNPWMDPIACDAGTYSGAGQKSCSICTPGNECPNAVTGPEQCALGKYSPGGKITACFDCPNGYYANSLGSPTCTICPDGSDCSVKTAAPTTCLAGTYSPHPSAGCLTCPDGTYQENAGQTGCKDCPPGKECSNKAIVPQNCGANLVSAGKSTSCVACGAGYKPSADFSRCEACALGNSCDGATQTPCSAGFYAAVKGQSSCSPCPSGFRCPNLVDPPLICNAGEYSPPESTTCTQCVGSCTNETSATCAANEYSLPGDPNCHLCPAGFLCSAQNVNPTACAAGQEYSRIGEITCTPCPAGYACPFADNEPILCDVGFYSAGNTDACTPCDLGQFCNETGMSAPHSCPPGTNTYQKAQSVCNVCPAGLVCAANNVRYTGICGSGEYSLPGAIVCETCPAGSECPDPVGMLPVQCGPGTYSTAGLARCIDCPRGKYCENPGSTAFQDCTPGTWSLEMESNPDCRKCPAGFECPTADIYPRKCRAGYWSSENSTSCDPCEAGFYCPAGSINGNHTACPDGYYCPSPTNVPQRCPAGTKGAGVVATDSAGDGCLPCDAGYYCRPGTVEPLTEDMKCPQGHYCAQGVAAPVACGGGFYNPNFGSTSIAACVNCPQGYYCPPGSRDYILNRCKAGRVCAINSADFSVMCNAGTFSSRYGLTQQSECDECPAGHDCIAGSVYPVPCQPGEYNPNTGGDGSGCVPCPAGRHCPYAGMDYSLPCFPGYWCAAGTSNPRLTPCQAGSYTNRDDCQNSNDCETCYEGYACVAGTGGERQQPLPCAPGYYCPGVPQPGDATQTYTVQFSFYGTATISDPAYACPGGTFNNRTTIRNQYECTICTPGYYCVSSGGLTKVSGICDAGYYCPAGSLVATEIACPVGTYSGVQGISELWQCITCPQGKYCGPTDHQTTPTNCPTGSYNDKLGATAEGPNADPNAGECIICPAGYYCGVAQVNPLECGRGYYSDSGASSCTVCDIGHYCPDNATTEWNMTNIYICSSGMYCPEGMTRESDLEQDECPVGKFCVESTPMPQDCPAGTYNPITGLRNISECTICPKGFYCENGSTSVTGQCRPGFYCDAGSVQDNQTACPSGTYRRRPGGDGINACAVCPNGYFCPEATNEPEDCPIGKYCELGTTNPADCPIGTYGNSTNMKSEDHCTRCPAGMYCLGGNAPTGNCEAGYFCIGSSSSATPVDPDTGGLCPKGGYCEEGSTYPSSCAKGSFNNETGGKSQADCLNCPGGYYCSGSNNPDPTDQCWEGYYCTGGASTPIQNLCPPGSYCPRGSSAPVPCPQGTYNAEFNQSSCFECPPGYYCPIQQMSTFENNPCPEGRYCENGTITPAECLSGTFSNQTKNKDASECHTCLPGKYCATTGLIEPTGDCDAGHFCLAGSNERDPVGQVYGDTCPAGSYCPSGTYLPFPCDEGKYYPYTGAVSAADCKNCDTGKYCEKTGLSAVTGDCFAGYYCNNGSASPTPLDGTLGNSCPQGHYCPTGTHIPIECPEGEFNSRTTQSVCVQCTAGYFCNGTTINPFICPKGNYCPAGTDSTIPECPTGSFSDTEGLLSQDQCTLCSGGRVCSATGLTSPDGDCNAGIYCEAGAEDATGTLGVLGGNTQNCPSGNYCPVGSSLPTHCPVGTFSGNTGNQDQSDCEICTPGMYCDRAGISAPTGYCAANYYCSSGAITPTPTDNNVTGDICPSGSYCEVGSYIPKPCPEGTYTGLEGRSFCDVCPAGYYCPEETSVPLPCVAGYYCPIGTNNTHLPCPPGSFSNQTGLSSMYHCRQCSGGRICTTEGLIEPDGDCPAGYYCKRGAIGGGLVGVILGESDECPKGHYCPLGSTVPIPCPIGTYLDIKQESSISDCLSCPPGKYCQTSGLELPSGDCDDGFFCSSGAVVPNPIDNNVTGDICPKGHYCVSGVPSPFECAEGTFSDDEGFSVCKDCPSSYYCPQNTIDPIICPSGKYCPLTTGNTIPVCPPGSFNNITGISTQGECTLCSEGEVCTVGGLTYPDDLCDAGYYCSSGAFQTDGTWGALGGDGGECPIGCYCPQATGLPFPCPLGTFNDGTRLSKISECKPCSAGMYCDKIGLSTPTANCSDGYYCPEGQHSNTSYICPVGSYCPGGSGSPILCADRTYQDLEGKSSCKVCPIGYYCPLGCSEPIICPMTSFCPDGRAHFCPNGTYGLDLGLEDSSHCEYCHSGRYCYYGLDQGECNAGHICYFGNGEPDPIGNGRRGDLCPVGHYCPNGTLEPIPCPSSVSSVQGGQNVSSCHPCRVGYYCIEGSVIEYPCSVGHYCDQNATGLGKAPIPCPIGTFRDAETGMNVSDCFPCQEGYYCPDKGMVSPIRRPCPTGHYCPSGTIVPIGCPGGTYRNETKSISPATCFTCPGGYYCGNGSTYYTECSEGKLCLPGTATPAPCPAGRYCLKRTAVPINCPEGYYCPLGSSFPQRCIGYVYCPENTAVPIPCPDGTTGNNATDFKVSLESSCVSCPAGTYSSISVGLKCMPCSAGHVCLSGANVYAPTNITTERGYICPRGYFCPNGTGSPIPCYPGSYSMNEGQALCDKCIGGSYQNKPGKTHCYPCGRSSWSDVGYETCHCNGTNRDFQFSDGACICKEGTVYFEENNVVSVKDDVTDCETIVYSRCEHQQIRNMYGICVDPEEFCEGACFNGGDGRLDSDIGICVCEEVVVHEDSVCDIYCRMNQLQIVYNPERQVLEIYDPTNDTIIEEFDVTKISSGDLYCELSSKCELNLVRLGSSGFEGVYDPSVQTLIDLFNLSSIHSALRMDYYDELTTSSRRAAYPKETNEASIPNPMVCLESGKGLVWDLENSGLYGYPVYIRDSLIRKKYGESQDVISFDYGSLRQLEEQIQSGMSVKTFTLTFKQSGTYVFGISNQANRIMIVRVMDTQERCPGSSVFQAQTTQSLVMMGISRKDEGDIYLTPDWILVIALLVGVSGFMLICIGGLHFFRTSTVIFSLAGARPKLPNFYQKIIKDELRKKTDQRLVGEGGIIDLEGFDVPQFYELLKKHNQKLDDAMSNYQQELKSRYHEIVDETNLIKDMILKRPDNGEMVVLLNVNKRIDNMTRYLSKLEASPELYDEESLKKLFRELDESMEELNAETNRKMTNQQLETIFGERDTKKYNDLEDKENRLRNMTLNQFEKLQGRLVDLADKMKVDFDEKKPKIMRGELLNNFGEIMKRGTRDLGKKMNVVNHLRIKLNQISDDHEMTDVNMNSKSQFSTNIAKLLNRFLVDILEDIFKKFKLFKDDDDDLEWELLFDGEADGDYLGDGKEKDFDENELEWQDGFFQHHDDLKKESQGFKKDVKRIRVNLKVQQTRELHNFKDEMKEDQKKIKELIVHQKLDEIKQNQISKYQERIEQKLDDPSLSEEEKQAVVSQLKKEMEWFENTIEKEKTSQSKQLDKLLREKMEKRRKMLNKFQKEETGRLSDQIHNEKEFSKRLLLSQLAEKEELEKIEEDDLEKEENKVKKANHLIARKNLIQEQITHRNEQKEADHSLNEKKLEELDEFEKKSDQQIHKQMTELLNKGMKKIFAQKKKSLVSNEEIHSEEKNDLLSQHQTDLKNMDQYLKDVSSKYNGHLSRQIEKKLEQLRKKEEEKKRSEMERALILQEKDVTKLNGIVEELKESQNAQKVKIEKLEKNMEEENEELGKIFQKEEEKNITKLNDFIKEQEEEIEQIHQNLEEEKNEQIDHLREKVEVKIKEMDLKRGGPGISEDEKKKLIFECNQHVKQYNESYNLQKQKQTARIQLLIEQKKKAILESQKKMEEKHQIMLLQQQEEKLNQLIKTDVNSRKKKKKKSTGLMSPLTARVKYGNLDADEIFDPAIEIYEEEEEIEEEVEEEKLVISLKEEEELEIHKLEEQNEQNMERLRREIEDRENQILQEFNQNLKSELEDSKSQFNKIKKQKAVALKKNVEEQMQNATSRREKQDILTNFKKQLGHMNKKIKQEQVSYAKQLQQRILLKKQQMFSSNKSVLEQMRDKQKEEEKRLRHEKQFEAEKRELIDALKKKMFGTIEKAINSVTIPRQNRELKELEVDEKDAKRNATSQNVADKSTSQTRSHQTKTLQSYKEVEKQFLRKRVQMKKRHLKEQIQLKEDLQKYLKIASNDTNFHDQIEEELTSFQKEINSEKQRLQKQIEDQKAKEKIQIERKLRAKMEEFRTNAQDQYGDLLKEEKMIDSVVTDMYQEKKKEEENEVLDEKINNLTQKMKLQAQQEQLLLDQEEHMRQLKKAFQNEYLNQMAYLELRIQQKEEEKRIHLEAFAKRTKKASRSMKMNIGMKKPTWAEFGRRFFVINRFKNILMKRLLKALESSDNLHKKRFDLKKKLQRQLFPSGDDENSDNRVRERTNSRQIRKKSIIEDIFGYLADIEFELSGDHLRPFKDFSLLKKRNLQQLKKKQQQEAEKDKKNKKKKKKKEVEEEEGEKTKTIEMKKEDLKLLFNPSTSSGKKKQMIFEFGKEVIGMLGEKFSFVPFNLKLAVALEPSVHFNNSFSELFHWNPKTKNLFLSPELLMNPGRFVLVIIHSSAHIFSKEKIFDDFGWKFIRNYFRMLKYFYTFYLTKMYVEED